MGRFVEVYVASDITFAYLVKAQLEDAGIAVQIANENLGDASCLDGMVPRVLAPPHRRGRIHHRRDAKRCSDRAKRPRQPGAG